MTLTNFSASCDTQVTLNWTTVSELNSDYFIVEKSRDGQTWDFLAEQQAAGNSNTTISYSQIDENSWIGITYYRLKQIDFNGAQEIYGPISSSCSARENSISVFPNPNSGSFTVEISSNKNNSAAIFYLTDMTGKIIYSKEIDISNGTNQILMNNLFLEKGAYIISLKEVDLQLKPVKVIVN